MIFSVDATTNRIILGVVGDDNVTEVHFDVKPWVDAYGDSGLFSLLNKRQGDTTAYPVEIRREGNTVIWTVSEIDTAKKGYGECELCYVVDDKTKYSRIFSTILHRSFIEVESPEPYEIWLDKLLKVEDKANANETKIQENTTDIEQNAADISNIKQDIIELEERKGEVIKLYFDGDAIYESYEAWEDAEAPMTFEEIADLAYRKRDMVYLGDGQMKYYPQLDLNVPTKDSRAIEFMSSGQLDGENFFTRVIINENNEVKTDQIVDINTTVFAQYKNEVASEFATRDAAIQTADTKAGNAQTYAEGVNTDLQAFKPTVPTMDEFNRLSESIDDISNDMGYVIDKKISKNIYDPSLLIPNYQLYSSGALGTNNDYDFTGYIDVSGCKSGSIAVFAKLRYPNAITQNAFYDENKNPVTTRNQIGAVLEAVPFTTAIPTGAKYFGIAYQKEHYIDGESFIMVQDGTEYTGYEPYGETSISVLPSDEVKEARGEFETLNERLESITPKAEVKKLVYWGDSLTEGNQAHDGGTIPQYMKNLLGDEWETINFGRGGDLANSIACRQGGMTFVVEPNQTIPSNGSVTLNIADNINSENVGIRLSESALGKDGVNLSLNPCIVNGIVGKLERTSSAYITNEAIFTRTESGNAVTISRPATVISNAEHYVGLPVVISIGQNGGFNTSNPEELLNIVRWVIDHANTDKYLVMGLYHSRGGLGYGWQTACNNLLMAEFGRKFIDAEAYMKTLTNNGSTYALEDEGLTPTANDLVDIQAEKYPRQIMFDAIHFNKYGYECIAKLQYQRGKELGYWS